MKYDNLERCTTPNTWKVWVECNDTIECIAIFKNNLDAHSFASKLESPYLITRSSTIAINKDENN